MRQRSWMGMLVVMVAACSDPGDIVKEEEVGRSESAMHPEVSLPGSDFEIDTDANIKVDDPAPSIDWGNVTEIRKPDEPTGQNDNSFGKGTKEDTAVPTVVAGSIPPNKSDLLTFGFYLEDTGSKKYITLFWHRVQEPNGTTNMDFELNQSKTLSSNGVTPERTSGDALIQYDLTKSGTSPELFLSKWIDGTEGKTAADCEAANSLPCWEKRVNLTTAGDARGSINTSAIPATDADGLGNISPRTFGEAHIDFDALVDDPTACVAFGSAYLKSRSSDSFTSALKDFIAPQSVNISNCGSVKVIKKDDAGNLLSGAKFELVEDADPTGGTMPGSEDTNVVGTCTTDMNGECTFTKVFQGKYWLIETQAPSCCNLPGTPYQHVEVVADEQVVKTFVDPRKRGAILVTKVRKHAADGAGEQPHEGVSFTVNGVTKTTDASGKVCFDNLLFGSYTVTESVPAHYKGEAPKMVTVDNQASCSDATYGGETVKFTNTPLSDLTVSFSSQEVGGTMAKISCSGLTATPVDSTPEAFDDTSETFEDLIPGTYTCTVVIDP